jgi:hypothetical protein
MDVDIIYSQSAFKHECTEADIRHAFNTRKYDSIVENVIDDDTVSARTNFYLCSTIGVTMPDLTEEEYDALDELWTKTTPKLGPNGSGFISHRELRLMGLDDLSRDYLLTKAQATSKTPAEIIGELVREKLASSAESVHPGK